MNFGEIIFYGVLGAIAVYLVVRLATAAYFKSKQQYDIQRKTQ